MSTTIKSESSEVSLATERLPRIVWATGWVSFLTDMSTEMVYGLLPAFYKSTLHINVAVMGIIEGVAETVVSLTKLFAGYWSDRTGKRKWWMLAGYSLSALSKPMMALFPTGGGAFTLRAADRFGKGIRGAPRDAILAREVPGAQRGRCFGIQRAMDHAGALCGALLAAGLLFLGWATVTDLLYWCAVPGLLAVLVIALFVQERDDSGQAAMGEKAPSLVEAWRRENPAFKRYLLVIAIFALGNSTDMLLLALAMERLKQTGLRESTAMAMLPLLWAWLHMVKSLASPWGGQLSDRIGRKKPVVAGWIIYALVYAGFALVSHTHVAVLWVLFGVYGVYYGLVEGAERALVADLAQDRSRQGGAYGLFYFVTGIVTLPASALCGGLWLAFGPEPAFLVGGALALLAAMLLPWALRGAVSK